MTDHTQTVADVKAQLLARGVPLNGPCGAFAITSRVVWILRAEGWGLIHSEGNGCDTNGDRYRADTCMLRDGTVIDMLTKSESDNGDISNPAAYNIPAWGQTGNQPAGNWREPFNPDAGTIPNPGPGPTPVPGECSCKAELVAIYQQLDEMQIVLHELRDKPAPNYEGKESGYLGGNIALRPVWPQRR